MNLLAALQSHDDLIAKHRLDLSVGGEPTFTDASRQDPPWLHAAEGGDKEDRAQKLAQLIAARMGDGASSQRITGRAYPGEPQARFAFRVYWQDQIAPLTVTPDPGVIEVNMAPERDLVAFARQTEVIFECAREANLSTIRYRFNGDETDSGGGGQLTFGASIASNSPFLRYPHALTGLVRMLQRHPSLSYFFSTECVGSSSQGPRIDEGVAERFDELPLALTTLESKPDVTPQEIQWTLASLLVDPAGNSHRAEINIEKLWNPSFGGRGTMGLVELRSLRMQPDVDRTIAVACLYRTLIARLIAHPYRQPLIAWGARLHDEFALPSVLQADLQSVLDDLRAHDLAVPPDIERLLLALPNPLCAIDAGATRLSVRRALEFWPLIDDVASQERQGARRVDSSTERFEVRVDAGDGGPGDLCFLDLAVPLLPHTNTAFLRAFRRRAYRPTWGFHPCVGPLDPLTIYWRPPGDHAFEISLHTWKPDGGVYEGLPGDAEQARDRRMERSQWRTTSLDLAGEDIGIDLFSIDTRMFMR